MAQDVTISVWCDWCDLLGMQRVPAVRTRVIAVDGPGRRVDICRRCDLLLADLEELYRSKGQELPLDAAQKAASKGEARELDGAAKPGSRERADKQYLVCPLPHKGPRSGPRRVAYADRDAHAAQVHDLRMWDVTWEDPDGILAVSCDAHQECRNSGLRFTSLRGKNNHIDKSSLRRIDISPDT
jgi:hypothetical protein